MKTGEIWKKIGYFLVVAFIFLVAGYVYCSPELSGKVLSTGDNQTYQGASRESWDYYEQTGEYTFWTGSMFCGMPNYQIGAHKFLSDKMLSPLNKIIGGTGEGAWTIFIYLICFFVCLRCFGVDRRLSVAGAFALALSSYFIVIIGAGHYTKTVTIAITAVTLGGFYKIFRKDYLLGAALVATFVALGYTKHPQMFYYYFMMIGLLWIAELCIHIKEKRIKDFAVASIIFFASVGLGLCTNASTSLTNKEYLTETIRGGQSELSESTVETKGLDLEYATGWSYGIGESLSFLVPGVMGGANSIDVGTDSRLYRELTGMGVPARNAKDFCSSAPMYWGDQPFTSGNVYMGAIVCFLFLLGLLVVEGPYKWALLASTLFSIALAWGSNFMGLTEFFFKYFPLYSKFRAVSSILIVAEVAMPLLGFLALKDIVGGKVEKGKLFKSLYISAGVTAGLCLILALLGGAMFSFTSPNDASWAASLPEGIYDAIIAQRASILRSDSMRSFLFIAAAFVLLYFYAKGKVKDLWFAVVLGAIIIVDMWPVDRRYFNDDFYVSPSVAKNTFAMQPYEQMILQDKGHFRVLNLTGNPWNESRTSYYLKSLGGYSAVKLRRYQDLIDEHLNNLELPVVGMLNARYFITEGADGQPAVQRNPYALGNAWFVDTLYVVDGARKESDMLSAIDLSHEAVLDRKFESFAQDLTKVIPEDASVVLNSYSPSELDYTCSSSEPSTVVFSEIYYPLGWKATIDGVPTDHFRANYVLRAINVPAGTHNIHFVFDPDSIRKGNAISAVCIVIMYLLLAASAVFAIRRKKSVEE